jgi:VWFA-related protein
VTPSFRSPRIFVAIGVVFTPFVVLGAQPPSGQPASTLHINSRLTVVDVAVTDSKGHPLHGLTQADFTLQEDGKPQPIRSFQEFASASSPAAQPAATLPPNVYTNLRQQPSASAINILLIDNLHVASRTQVFVKQEVASYLKDMVPGTQIAIFEMTNTLRLVQDFTSNQQLLSKAMDAMPIVPYGREPTGPLDQCAQRDARNRNRLQQLDQIADFVAGIRGRKNLIWFMDGGNPALTDQGYRTVVNHQIGFECLPDITAELRHTYNLLTAAQVALYPIDGHGLVNNRPIMSIADAATTAPPGVNMRSGSINMPADLRPDVKGYEDNSMEALAKATGGIAFYDTNGLGKAAADAIAKGAEYYTLSYVPPLVANDGKYHTIEIKVDRPGVHLEYRKGYNAEGVAHPAPTTRPQTALDDRVLAAAMARGALPSTEIVFDVQVQPARPPSGAAAAEVLGALDPKQKGKPLTRYDLQYIFRADQISFADAVGGAHTGSLELDVVAYDSHGLPLTSLSQKMTLPLKPDAFQHLPEVILRCAQQIDLPLATASLRMAMIDFPSGTLGTLEVPISLAKR